MPYEVWFTNYKTFWNNIIRGRSEFANENPIESIVGNTKTKVP